jgi:hypothetical protein
MEKTAVIWPFRYKSFNPGTHNSWEKRMKWVAKALIQEGYTVLQHQDFVCDVPGSKPYNGEAECDIVVYNHSDLSEIRGNIIKANKTWFFKPTIPDENQCTLDTLGYGPYSTPTYNKPDLDSISEKEVTHFYNTKVKGWKTKNVSKWGKNHFKKTSVTDKGYYLVLGQVFNDTVVTRHEFGNYADKLLQVVRELNAWTDEKIIVKLHPYTNGVDYAEGVSFNFIEDMERKLKGISPDIEVVSEFVSLYSYLPGAKCVVLSNSGSGLEALMYDKPVISFGMPEYHWVTYDLRKVCDVQNAVKVDNWHDVLQSRKYLYWYMKEYCFYDQKSANRRVKELINE